MSERGLTCCLLAAAGGEAVRRVQMPIQSAKPQNLVQVNRRVRPDARGLLNLPASARYGTMAAALIDAGFCFQSIFFKTAHA